MAKFSQAVSVLVVDDNQFTLTTVSKTLNNLGIDNVETAVDGRMALELLHQAHVDVVICDLNMPEMDGVEFLRHLADNSFRGGVILVSGEDRRLLSTAEALAGAHDLHVLGAVEKPIRATEIAELLNAELAAPPEAEPPPESIVSPEELKAGIKNDELVVFYQPKILIATREITGAECLVRWIRPDGGMVPPNAFVPMAEEHDLINALTESVFEQAVRQGANGGEWGWTSRSPSIFRCRIWIKSTFPSTSSHTRRWPD